MSLTETGTAEVKSKKVFSGAKLDMGICCVDGKVCYGGHLTGVISEASKSAFSILSTDKDTTEDVQVDTFIFIHPSQADGIAEINMDESRYGWFTGAMTNPGIPGNISEAVRKIILKDTNKWKGMYKDKDFHGIPTDPEQQELVLNVLSESGKIEELITFYKQLKVELDKERKASASVELPEFIERYAFKEHILLSGPAGTSKTYTADQFLTAQGCHKEFVAGHAGLESTDLLGYPIRHTDGSFVWMDGALTAAFRRAQTEKVGLFIDELLRIPARELNILIGALTPNSSKQFVLRTNRLTDIEDGIGTSETLIVPMENLWVVATTNVGSNYNVEDMDLALNDRFVTHDVSISDDTIFEIMNINNVHGLDTTVMDKSMKLFKAINALVSANELTHSINVRHMSKVLKNVEDPTQIKSYFFDMAPNICSRTTEGKLNESELKIYKDTIKSLF